MQGLAQANHLHFWCLVFRCFQIFRIKTQDSLLSLPRWMCFAWSSTWTNFSISWGRRSWTLQMGTSSQKLGSWQDNFWRRSRSWRKPTSKKCARTVLLQFGASKIEEDEALAVTPLQRNLGHVEPLNTMADYLLLAVARQLTLLKPDAVSAIHSFKELYEGRLMTEPWTCFSRGCP